MVASEKFVYTPGSLCSNTHFCFLEDWKEYLLHCLNSAHGRAENNAESNKNVYIRRTENAGEPHC